MNILSSLFHKLKARSYFLLKKWGLMKPDDIFSISKLLLKGYLSSSPVIIDCGAHVGDDSIELACLFPKGMIHSFEPVPNLFRELEKKTLSYRNIYRYQVALSNADSTAMMYVSSGTSDASSSLLAPALHLQDHPKVFFEEKIEVKTSTLDTWAKENNIAAVDFLWLDMQGFEFSMLERSTVILPTVKVIHSEVSFKESYRNCILYADFRVWLENKGFSVVAEAIPPGTDMGNVLFVRK